MSGNKTPHERSSLTLTTWELRPNWKSCTSQYERYVATAAPEIFFFSFKLQIQQQIRAPGLSLKR